MRGSKRSPRASRARMRRLASRIVRRFRPERIILFGSHVYGSPTDDSDVDLLVVAKRKPDAAAVRCALPDSTSFDILTLSSSELGRRLRSGDEFLREIVERGMVLYETRRARVG